MYFFHNAYTLWALVIIWDQDKKCLEYKCISICKLELMCTYCPVIVYPFKGILAFLFWDANSKTYSPLSLFKLYPEHLPDSHLVGVPFASCHICSPAGVMCSPSQCYTHTQAARERDRDKTTSLLLLHTSDWHFGSHCQSPLWRNQRDMALDMSLTLPMCMALWMGACNIVVPNSSVHTQETSAELCRSEQAQGAPPT